MLNPRVLIFKHHILFVVFMMLITKILNYVCKAPFQPFATCKLCHQLIKLAMNNGYFLHGLIEVKFCIWQTAQAQ